MKRRYVKRRRPTLSQEAQRQLVALALDDDIELAQMAALELMDRVGNGEVDVSEVCEDRVVSRVFRRWWLRTVLPHVNGVMWRVAVPSAHRRRWLRACTRVGAEMPAGVVLS